MPQVVEVPSTSAVTGGLEGHGRGGAKMKSTDSDQQVQGAEVCSLTAPIGAHRAAAWPDQSRMAELTECIVR